MDVREEYVLQKVNRKEKSICPNCIHHNLCIAENNQPCFECNRFIDAHGVTVQEWISVKDRLPEKDIRVLVWMQDNEEGYTQIDTDRFSCTMEQGYHWIRWGKSVTHWLPLPQPPKGE